MKKLRALGASCSAALALALLSACAGSPVLSFSDGSIDTSRYRSYQWVDQDAAHSLRLDNPPNTYPHDYTGIERRPVEEEEAKRAINQDLQKAGYVEAAEKPDFFVTYFARAKDRDWVSTWEGSTPAGPGGIPFVMYPHFDPSLGDSYRKNALVVVFYDAATRRPVWTGNILNALAGQKIDKEKVTADLSSLVSKFHRSVSTPG